MITSKDYLMGRDKLNPITDQMRDNIDILLKAVNGLLNEVGMKNTVSSGYRPSAINSNAGGAKKSAHLTCEAVDLVDINQKLSRMLLKRQDILANFGLYMEHPDSTKTWIHLQTRRPKSGNRVFLP